MKQVFIQARKGYYRNDYITLDTLDGIHMEYSFMTDVIQECRKLSDKYDMFIFDVQRGFYDVVCDSFLLDRSIYIHVYKVLTVEEVNKMRDEVRTLVGFWKLYKEGK